MLDAANGISCFSETFLVLVFPAKQLSEYQRSRLFFDLGQRSLRFQS